MKASATSHVLKRPSTPFIYKIWIKFEKSLSEAEAEAIISPILKNKIPLRFDFFVKADTNAYPNTYIYRIPPQDVAMFNQHLSELNTSLTANLSSSIVKYQITREKI